jgi:basic membrane lipoprotein Med (substrate-binding protein (PBP1-ABC) superfamily)
MQKRGISLERRRKSGNENSVDDDPAETSALKNDIWRKKMRRRAIRQFMLLTGLLCVAILVTACAAQPTPEPTTVPVEPTTPKEEPTEPPPEPTAVPTEEEAEPCLTVGIIYVGPVTDAGFNQAQHDGLMEMKENIPCIETIEAENIAESAEAESTLETMIQQGAELIFATSFGHMEPAYAVAEKYPEVTFLHAGGYLLADNFGTYFTTMPKHLYLMGVAAGKMTQTNKIGYIGAFPIGFTIANINAFALGAQSVNPDIETHVVWTFSWLDRAKEVGATNALVDEGVDVVTMHVDSPVTIIQTAEEAGIYSIGFHSAAGQQFAPNGWITGLEFVWGPFMTETAQQVMDGTWEAAHVRKGIEVGWMAVAPFGQAVPQDVQDLVLSLAEDMANFTLDPFAGPLIDQEGTVRVAEGETVPNEELGNFDWFVQGVIGEPPQ